MLPPKVRNFYQQFKQALQEVLLIISIENTDGTVLKHKFEQLQQIFQQEISSQTAEFTDELPRSLSVQTEIHRLLKLLAMDVMFLQVSRQSETTKNRQVAMRDRINTLIAFCDGILQDSGQLTVDSLH